MSNVTSNKDHITYLDNKSSTLYRYYCHEDRWSKRTVTTINGVSQSTMALELFQDQLNRAVSRLTNAQVFIDFDEAQQQPVLKIQGWQEVSPGEAHYLLGLMYEELDWYANHLLQQDEVVSSVKEAISEEQNGLQTDTTDAEKMNLIRASIQSGNHSLELSQADVSMGRGGRIQYIEQMIGCLVGMLNEENKPTE